MTKHLSKVMLNNKIVQINEATNPHEIAKQVNSYVEDFDGVIYNFLVKLYNFKKLMEVSADRTEELEISLDSVDAHLSNKSVSNIMAVGEVAVALSSIKNSKDFSRILNQVKKDING